MIYRLKTGKDGVKLRGAAAELWRSHEHEVIIQGPAETGKTFAALHKLDALLWKYPKTQAVIIRKTYKSTVASVLQTYQHKVLREGCGIAAFGGEKPEWFDYPHGSRLWVGGMDNADKVLSTERDFIYVNQAEELELAEWETLCTRCTGRAGNTPYAQIFGDCNPAYSEHWIRQRSAAGQLKLLSSRLEDNPTLYDDAGQITEQGKATLAVLQALTGLRYRRLFLGEWCSLEGAIAQREWFPIIEVGPSQGRRIRFWDFAATMKSAKSADPDWTVGTRMAVVDGMYFVEHVIRGRWGPGEVEHIVSQTAQADGKAVAIAFEQEPGAAGKLFTSALIRALAGYTVRAVPASGDKVTRVTPFFSQAKGGNVKLISGGWVGPWLDEICAFPPPVGRHDDQVDSGGGAFGELTGHSGWSRGPAAS